MLYAIGEILLVVIGILIALSIDNWNTDREERKQERKIYVNLKGKLLEDRNTILANYNFNEGYLQQFEYASEILKNPVQDQMDTLVSILPGLFQYSNFDGSSNIYQNLLNSGDLKLIRNEEIITRMQRLEEAYYYMNRMEDNHFQVILTYVVPALTENLNFATGQMVNSGEIVSYKSQNLLLAILMIVREKKYSYQKSIDQIDTILLRIDGELIDNKDP